MSEISVFDHLKPFCVRAIENPSKESFSDLENVLTKQLLDVDNVETILLPPFQEYLSFPMKMVLLQNKKFSEATSISALKTLNSLLRLSISNNWESFSKTFTQLFTTISNPSCQIQDNKYSDEFKMEIINCCQTLISKNTHEIQYNMMGSAFCPALGHSVLVLLWMSQNEKSRELRIAAMEAIISLFSLINPNEVLLSSTGKRLASFLPGICIAMTEVAIGDTKQGSRVTLTSLKVWSFIVSIVMSDENLSISKDEEMNNLEVEVKVPEVIRTIEWVEDTSSKLAILMEKIASLVSHEKWKVRLALLKWAKVILTQCTSSLGKHIQIPLDIVITLNLDEYKEVSYKSEKILECFSHLLKKLEKKDLKAKLETNVYSLCTKLPRIFRVLDDNEKVSALNLLAGYIKILGRRKIRLILLSTNIMDRLMLSLMQLIQFDTNQVLILDNKTTPSQQETMLSVPTITWPRKYFKHFRDDKVFTTFCNVCRQLGLPGNITHIVDYLLEKARQSSLYRKEAILILNEILMGQIGYESYNEDPLHLVERVIEEYISDNFWNVQVVETKTQRNQFREILSEENDDLITPEKIRSNIIQKCLLLEGISRFSELMTKDFQIVLLTILCPFLEEVGSPAMQISHTATLGLKLIAENSMKSEIPSLIFENCDYLAHALSVKLRHIDEFPNAPIVLDVVCRFGEAKILPLLQDLIFEVLRLVDTYHHEKGMQLLKVLHTLLMAIVRWFDCDKPKPEAQIPPTVDLERLNLKDFLLEYHRLHIVAENLTENTITKENLTEDEIEEELTQPEKVVKKENHIDIAISVLNRCVHMQSSPSLPVRILTQDLIQLGVKILKQNEDDLLPLVHELWGPLVRRFTRDENVVTLKAFETLLVLAEVCGDFIRKRTLREVWSKIISVLEQQRLISRGKDDGTAYRFTIQYKLQLKILSNLGKLVKMLEVRENELESTCCLVIAYLSDKHPQTLLQAAKDTIKVAETVDPDLVWFAIKNYSGSEPLQLPHKDLCPPLFHKPKHVKF